MFMQKRYSTKLCYMYTGIEGLVAVICLLPLTTVLAINCTKCQTTRLKLGVLFLVVRPDSWDAYNQTSKVQLRSIQQPKCTAQLCTLCVLNCTFALHPSRTLISLQAGGTTWECLLGFFECTSRRSFWRRQQGTTNTPVHYTINCESTVVPPIDSHHTTWGCNHCMT